MSTFCTPAAYPIQPPLTQFNNSFQIYSPIPLNDSSRSTPLPAGTINGIPNSNPQTQNQALSSNSILNPNWNHTSINNAIQNIAQPVLNINGQTPINTQPTEQTTVESLDLERLRQRQSSRENMTHNRQRQIFGSESSQSNDLDISIGELPVPPPLHLTNNYLDLNASSTRIDGSNTLSSISIAPSPYSLGSKDSESSGSHDSLLI